MKNTSIKSLKALCIRAKYDNQHLYFLYDFNHRWYVSLKGFGCTRSYRQYDFIHAALLKACAKYGVSFVY